MVPHRPRLALPASAAPAGMIHPRRRFLAQAGALAAGLVAAPGAMACGPVTLPAMADDERPNSWEQITRYNNYYEFSTDKDAVAVLAAGLRMKPWAVSVDGEVDRPRVWDVEQLLARFPQAARVLRLRCVEGWSMVVPWNGFPLCELLREAVPGQRARYVRFTALSDPAQMPGLRLSGLEWPYTEALTLAEAMHPLTLLATGLHGRPLPPQNGGPLRLVVPWKYGYKSIKAIVRISLTAERPQTTWSRRSPDEYGFYGNVNPDVPHPRWSQARETRIGEVRKRPTLPFNGYADLVAGLYAGLDPGTLS